MNRAERRRQRLGRSPTVVAMPTLRKKSRLRVLTDAAKERMAAIEISPGRDGDDMNFVRTTLEGYAREHGTLPTMLDPTAPVVIARHRITGERLGMVTIKPIPPGKMYVENFLVVKGRQGRAAARALCEWVRAIPSMKVCVVAAHNAAMLEILDHYGGRVVGFLVEGPYTGAPEVPAAAEPLEQTV